MPLISDQRTYLSRYVPINLGLTVRSGADLADPDGNSLLVTMNNALDQPVFSARGATRIAVGEYEVALTSDDLAVPGPYDLVCNYALATVLQSFVVPIAVGELAPVYDSLNDDMRQVVEQTYIKFADLFDAPVEGPHLQVYVQTHFGRNRLAQLLISAVHKLNVIAQPHSTYEVDDFPVDSWGGLVEQMLYVEILEHLQRSYVEQPNDTGVSVAFANRRDYWDRWGTLVNSAKAELKEMMDVFKMANMGLSQSARLLVSGGVFGRAPGRRPPTNAARPRFDWRFY